MSRERLPIKPKEQPSTDVFDIEPGPINQLPRIVYSEKDAKASKFSTRGSQQLD